MCRSVIVDAKSEPQLEPLLCGIAIPLVIICPDHADATELAAEFPAHRIIKERISGLTSSNGVRSMSRPIRLLISSSPRRARAHGSRRCRWNLSFLPMYVLPRDVLGSMPVD
jgi:hypothetical protein